MKFFFLSIAFTIDVLMCAAQSVGIGTSTPHPSAQLEVSSTNKGTLITTMTSSQRTAILNPATGLLVYDLNKKTIYMYDGNRWVALMYSNSEKNPPTMLTPSFSSDDYAGYKVDIDGNYAIVGAYGRTLIPNPIDAGVAYIYFRNNGVWELQDIIQANDGQTNDFFGASVRISGDYAIVGAWGDDIGTDNDQGSAYIFVRNGTQWTLQAKITAIDGLANDFFGRSVSIDGDHVIIGAQGDDNGANINQGSAYIFYRSGTAWSLGAKLTASDGSAEDFFGSSVAIDGAFAIVGAYGDDVGSNTDQGSVYSFYQFTNAGGWTTGQAYHQKITASDGDAGDFFGVSVAISGVTLVIGASGDDIGLNSDQGSVYSYFKGGAVTSNWASPDKIVAPDGAANDNFGISVSRASFYILVGAYRDDGVNGVANQGSVYLFNASGSNPQYIRKIEDDDGQQNGYFGFSIGISGYEVIIGAYGKNSNRGQVGFLNIQ